MLLLLRHLHLFELVQVEDAVAVRVVLDEFLLDVVLLGRSALLGVHEDEVVLPAVLVVEAADDLEAPESFVQGDGGTLLQPFVDYWIDRLILLLAGFSMGRQRPDRIGISS